MSEYEPIPHDGLDPIVEARRATELDKVTQHMRELVKKLDVVEKTELQSLRAENTRLRAIIEQAASAPGKDWLEWRLKLAAALTPQDGKGGGND